MLAAARAAGMLVIHTREGHRPDLSDAPPAKIERGASVDAHRRAGPMGRILIRGEAGHDIIPELYPIAGEPVIDKPGKGAFYATDLHAHAAQSRHRASAGRAASPPRSASTPRCARPTTAAIAASCSPTAAAPTSRNSTRWACDDQGAGRRSSAGSRIRRACIAALSRRQLRARQQVESSDGRAGHDDGNDGDGIPAEARGRRATGTPSSASAPTSSSTCWC